MSKRSFPIFFQTLVSLPSWFRCSGYRSLAPLWSTLLFSHWWHASLWHSEDESEARGRWRSQTGGCLNHCSPRGQHPTSMCSGRCFIFLIVVWFSFLLNNIGFKLVAQGSEGVCSWLYKAEHGSTSEVSCDSSDSSEQNNRTTEQRNLCWCSRETYVGHREAVVDVVPFSYSVCQEMSRCYVFTRPNHKWCTWKHTHTRAGVS